MQSKYVEEDVTNPARYVSTERVSSMTPHEADVWRKELMDWIDRNHPHMLERDVMRILVDQSNYWRQAYWELMWHEHSSYKLLVDKYQELLKTSSRIAELEMELLKAKKEIQEKS